MRWDEGWQTPWIWPTGLIELFSYEPVLFFMKIKKKKKTQSSFRDHQGQQLGFHRQYILCPKPWGQDCPSEPRGEDCQSLGGRRWPGRAAGARARGQVLPMDGELPLPQLWAWREEHRTNGDYSQTLTSSKIYLAKFSAHLSPYWLSSSLFLPFVMGASILCLCHPTIVF